MLFQTFLEMTQELLVHSFATLVVPARNIDDSFILQNLIQEKAEFFNQERRGK